MPEQKPYLPMCRHGVVPFIERQRVDVGLSGTFNDTIPGRAELVYQCPTPGDCAHKAEQYLIDAGIEPPA